MSSYCEQLRARIAEKRRKLEEINSANLFPIGGSVNAVGSVKQELRRQITVYEAILADHLRY